MKKSILINLRPYLNVWSIALFGLILSTLICLQLFYIFQKRIHAKGETTFQKSNLYLQEKVDSYIHGLQGIGGIYLTHDLKPEHKVIRHYAAFRNFYDNFPGSLGFGFIRRINKYDAPNYVENMRKHINDFEIRHLPSYNTDLAKEYFIIESIEPIEKNTQARGLNVASEPNRESAAIKSMLTGKPVLTHQIQLVQSQKKEPGFLLYLPIYTTGIVPATESERKQLLAGWTYTPITLQNLLNSVNYMLDAHLYLKITDLSEYDQDIIFQDPGYNLNTDLFSTNHYFESQIQISGRTWKLEANFVDPINSKIYISISVLIFISLNLLFIFGSLKFQKYLKLNDQTQLRAKSAEGWQSAVLNGSNFSIIATTPDGTISTFNRAAQKQLGYSEHEVVGKVTPAIIHDLDEIIERTRVLNAELQTNISPGFETFILKAKKFGVDTNEWTYVKKDKTRYPVRLTVTPIYDDVETMQIIGYLGIAEDISQLKKLTSTIEEQKAKFIISSKMSLLGEMAAGIAHEINNPLAIISGKASQIARRIQNTITTKAEFDYQKTSDDLQKIDQTIIRISKIIKGLRSFSRSSENDPMEYAKIETIIEDTLELCKQRFINNQIDLRVDCPSDIKAQCRATQLSQVIMNLLSNAFDAIEKLNEKWVQIKVVSHDEMVEISVTDSGNGIPSSVREKMLQPFYTTKEVGKGTGLGLSISKGIIEDHGGQFYYDQNSTNTSFVIKIPISQTQSTHVKIAS